VAAASAKIMKERKQWRRNENGEKRAMKEMAIWISGVIIMA
jgi:hypothetical protein